MNHSTLANRKHLITTKLVDRADALRAAEDRCTALVRLSQALAAENAQLTWDSQRQTKALSDSESRNRFALEVARMGVWEMDLETRRMHWSPSLSAVLGLTDSPLPGCEDLAYEFLHPDDRPALQRAVDSALRTGADFNIEVRWVWPHKRLRWVQMHGHVAHGVADRATRMVGVGIDITARRALEAQFQQAQKMEAIGEIAGSIAHDFNNLLTVILGFGKFLYDDLADTPHRESIDEVLSAGRRAVALTSQLLTLSRKQVVRTTDVNINDVVPGLWKMLSRLVREDVELTFAPGDNVPIVRADVGQIAQVLTNLIVNARDAMPSGGRILVETARVQLDGQVRIGRDAVIPGTYLMLAVSDTGTGIDDATIRRIFEPPFTLNEQATWTGLGLAAVFGIVTQSSGHIGLDSELGRGTTFRIYLPTASVDEGSASTPVAMSTP